MRKAYKKLTYADRQEIEQMSERGEKPKAIADATGVCFQTIYRELQRGKKRRRQYAALQVFQTKVITQQRQQESEVMQIESNINISNHDRR